MNTRSDILVYSFSGSQRENSRVCEVLKAAPEILDEAPVPVSDSCHWLASHCRLVLQADRLFVVWKDKTAMASSRQDFGKAWAEIGDGRPVLHKLSEELTDDDLPF